MDEIFKINGNFLDEDQQKIVLDSSKALLVIAGAGSGKTFTILGKVQYLIKRLNFKEKDILCISLTNDTVKNLKDKLLNLSFDITVLTFHKLGLTILQKFNENIGISSEDYLNMIIDEYFLSYVMFKKELKRKFMKYLDLRLFENFLNSYKYGCLKNLIFTAIHLIKSNDIDLKDVLRIYNRCFFDKTIMKYIVDIYLIYKRELEGSGLIDFDDMINEATKLVKRNNIDLGYKYVIIDEYQDTSIARYNLIKAIIDVSGSKIMAVGDDWQSIYRFTGCELSIFLNFKEYFDNANILPMGNTYRNSQELIDVASAFIMKNPKQIKKVLRSKKHLDRPIKIIYDNGDKYILNKIANMLETEDIMVLGRNNYDIKNYNTSLKYLTVHKSKGLEAEKIILINLENKIDGFPNKKKDERVLNKIKNNICTYPFDEERRLFYVALTRTKSDVYLLINKKNMSVFVKELMKDYKEYIEFLDI